MNILIYRWDIFPYDHIIKAFKEQGHHVDVPALPEINHLHDEAGEAALKSLLLSSDYDLVFSVNYLAAIARVCYLHSVRYVSWTLDTPLISLQTDTIYYPTNRIFTFDEAEYHALHAKGVTGVHYLPLAGPQPESGNGPKEGETYSVSFVGNLYDKNLYDEFCACIPDYLCGYLDAVLEAQSHIDSGNIIQPMISDEIWQALSPYVTSAAGGDNDFPDAGEVLKSQFNTRVLYHRASKIKRIATLNALAAAHHEVHLFTTSDPSPLHGVHVHPPAEYQREAPQIYASSKINLNITSPNLTASIPLRVWDILSAGGFLLTDYRPQYHGLLEDGKDLVFYDGIADLLRKADYYLSHDEERRQIAENGQKKMQQYHNYDCRIRKMLSSIGQS